MIHIEEAVIVEGKYDKIKLSNFLDAMISVVCLSCYCFNHNVYIINS
mgnify:CR=1 FL=1